MSIRVDTGSMSLGGARAKTLTTGGGGRYVIVPLWTVNWSVCMALVISVRMECPGIVNMYMCVVRHCYCVL